jgi:hypothetical protein
MSPPDSKENSSEDEDEKAMVSRDIENLAELQAAIRIIGQHRESSPNRSKDQGSDTRQHLTLIMPQSTDEKPVTVHVEQSTVNTIRKIAHNRSNTEPTSVLLDLQNGNGNAHGSETPLSGSDEDS